MKIRTSLNEYRYRLPVVLLLALLLTGTASAQHFLNAEVGKACKAGFSGTWIIGDVCDLCNRIDLKTDDAIDIQCDSQTDRWSVDFYVEPANADPNAPTSQAEQYRLCPGNGYLTENEEGKQVLRCNYWESANNVAKQLEFELLAMTDPGIRNISWLNREIDNPNVICGVASRGDDGSASGSGGQTIDSN